VAAAATVLVLRDPAPREPRFRPPPGTVYLGVSTDESRLAAFSDVAGLSRPAGLYGRWTTPDGPFEPVLADARRHAVTPVVHWNLPPGRQPGDVRPEGRLSPRPGRGRAVVRPTGVRPAGLGVQLDGVPALDAAGRAAAAVHPELAACGGAVRGRAQRRVRLLRGPDGMEDMAAFAVAHGKPLMLAEWAPDLPNPDTAAPVDLVLDWADRNPVVQALVYFDFAVDGKDYTLARHPVGAAEYRRRTADRARFLLEVVG
jgi:hypothetical protein